MPSPQLSTSVYHATFKGVNPFLKLFLFFIRQNRINVDMTAFVTAKNFLFFYQKRIIDHRLPSFLTGARRKKSRRLIRQQCSKTA